MTVCFPPPAVAKTYATAVLFFSGVFGAAVALKKRLTATTEAMARKRRPAAAPKKRPAAATEARTRKGRPAAARRARAGALPEGQDVPSGIAATRARDGLHLETRPAAAAEVAGQGPAAAAAVAVQGPDATDGQAPATRWPSHPPVTGERALLLLPGDGWSMRESTSRPGFYYYFNDRTNRYATLDAHSLCLCFP